MPQDEVARRCERANVSWAPVGQPGDLFADPHLLATGGLRRRVHFALRRRRRQVGRPAGPADRVRRRPPPPRPRRQPPRIGEHNAEVLAEAGFSPEIAALAESGVITHQEGLRCCRPNASIIPRSPSARRSRCPAARAWPSGSSSISRNGTPPETMPRTVLTPPAGGSPMPDIPNWAWHEYGNRVGFWRMLDVFDELRIPRRARDQRLGDRRATSRSSRAALERDWEFIGHGFSQKNMQKVADERDDIRKTAAAIREVHRQEPARLARPGTDRDLGDPRPPGRGRLRIRLRLGARRRAGRAEDARRADRQHPVHAGMQRCRDDADPAPQGERIPRPRARPVRAALQRRSGRRPRDGAGAAPLHHGRAAPAAIRPRRARPHPRRTTTSCSGPASRYWNGIWGSAADCGMNIENASLAELRQALAETPRHGRGADPRLSGADRGL